MKYLYTVKTRIGQAETVQHSCEDSGAADGTTTAAAQQAAHQTSGRQEPQAGAERAAG